MESVFVDFETVCNYIIEHFTAKISGIPDLAGILESGIYLAQNFLGFGISYRIFEDFGSDRTSRFLFNYTNFCLICVCVLYIVCLFVLYVCVIVCVPLSQALPTDLRLI